MSTITPERVQEIRARLAAATPGPWMTADDHLYPQRVVANDDGLVLIAETYTDPAWPPADADLIAHAPADLADLLDEREKLLAVYRWADHAIDVLRQDSDSDLDEWFVCRGIAAVRAYRAATTWEPEP